MRYAKQCSKVAEVKASVTQSSGLNPASHFATAADLQPITANNYIFKFAYDTYLVIPEVNSNIYTLKTGQLKTTLI